jgi:hypothetical protein
MVEEHEEMIIEPLEPKFKSGLTLVDENTQINVNDLVEILSENDNTSRKY